MNDKREPKIEDLEVEVGLRILTNLVAIANAAIDLDHNLQKARENLREKCTIVLNVTEAIAQEMLIVPEDHQNLRKGRNLVERQKGVREGDLRHLGREAQAAAHDQVAQVRSTDLK